MDLLMDAGLVGMKQSIGLKLWKPRNKRPGLGIRRFFINTSITRLGNCQRLGGICRGVRSTNSFTKVEIMNTIEKTFQHLLAGLDDRELEILSSVMYREVDTRIQSKITNGYYPNPLSDELEIWSSGNKLKAIQAYRSRVKDTGSIRATKVLFETCLRS